MRDRGNFAVEILNRQLIHLRLRTRIMDETTFEPIIVLFEKEQYYEVERLHLH